MTDKNGQQLQYPILSQYQMFQIYALFQQQVRKEQWEDYHTRHRPIRPNKAKASLSKSKSTTPPPVQVSAKIKYTPTPVPAPSSTPAPPRRQREFGMQRFAQGKPSQAQAPPLANLKRTQEVHSARPAPSRTDAPSAKYSQTAESTRSMLLSEESIQQCAFQPSPHLAAERKRQTELPPKQAVPLQQYPEEGLEMILCPEGCGRQFNPNSLAKHQKVCRQVFKTKRREFDSSKMRATDESREVAKRESVETKDNKWQQKSLAFRAALKVGKGEQMTEEERLAVEATKDAAVECPHCKRRFNHTAGQKHIAFCQKQKAKMARK